MLRLLLGWLVVASLFSNNVLANQHISPQDDAWLMLQKTAYAARELSYQGVFVYQNGTQTRSVQITHMNHGGSEMTRNIVLGNQPNGNQPREVYSHGNEIFILHPVQQKVLIEKRRGQSLFPALLPTDLSLLKTSYAANHAGNDNIAGRPTYIIELTPNDAYRYRYKVWADVETGLLLKLSLSSLETESIEQIAFSQFSMITSADTDWFKPKMDMHKSYVVQEAPMEHVNDQKISVQLPAGYRQVDHISRTVPGKNTPVNQVIYSDGIASVSLFIEPITRGARPKHGHTVMGSTNMSASVIDGHQVVVVGEVPAATVNQISKTVSLKPTH